MFNIEIFRVKDWGIYISLSDLSFTYHIPSSQELKLVIRLVENALNQSISFLSKSILHEKLASNLNVSKEENYRELNFIYHILYGSSRLLKRPGEKNIAIEQ